MPVVLDALSVRVFEQAARLAAEQLEVDRVGVWVFEGRRTRPVRRAAYDRGAAKHDPDSVELDGPISFLAGLTKGVVRSKDEANGATLLDAPIVSSGPLYGFVRYEHGGEGRRWTPREMELARSLGELVALQIEAAAAARAVHAQERELMHAERLATVGVLARHVAHDLNNAVAPILMCAAQLRACTWSESALERVEIIQNAAEHGASLAKRLLTTEAGAATIRDAVELDAELLRIEPLLRAVADRASLELELAAPRRRVPADAADLSRVVAHLLTNARDALPEGGGIVRLKTSADDEFVTITVSDDGRGIDEDDQRRLFQPFFTTKPGRGTGLGLAAVQAVVEVMRGRITVESAPGRGTTVTVTLPAALEDAPP